MKIVKDFWMMYHIATPIFNLLMGKWFVFRECPEIVVLNMYYDFKKPFTDLTLEEEVDFENIRNQIFEEYSLRKRKRDILRLNRKIF